VSRPRDSSLGPAGLARNDIRGALPADCHSEPATRARNP
jgi:hypothetical protein